MICRSVVTAFVAFGACCQFSGIAAAQDVPGIEICTVDKTMERRTSCLQSNVIFLQKTITKLGNDSQLRLDAANRQIEALKTTVLALQKTVDDLQAAQKKQPAAAPSPAAKDVPPASKDGTK